MSANSIRRIATIAAGGALAVGVAFPGAGLADQGGVPHSAKPCKVKSKGNGPKHAAPNSHGKKCGFNRAVEEPPAE